MVYTDGTYLVADSIAELHEFATSIYLKREWFNDHIDHPHYLLWGTKKNLAIKRGAAMATPAKIISMSVKMANEYLSPIMQKLKQLDSVLQMDGYYRNSEPRKIISQLKKEIETPNNE